jgi:hypothetical protein
LASKFIGTKKFMLLWTAPLILSLTCQAESGRPPKMDSTSASPTLEIHLRDLGYRAVPEYQYPVTEVPRDLSILNDDSKKRITFVDEKTLVVYQSHYTPQNKEGQGYQGTWKRSL